VLMIAFQNANSSVSEWSATLLLLPSLVAMFFGRPLARDIGGVGLADVRFVLISMLVVAISGFVVMIEDGYNAVAKLILVVSSVGLFVSASVIALTALQGVWTGRAARR
jgi:hypothetical protein